MSRFRPPPGHGTASSSRSGKVITFPGFLRAYVEGSDDPRADVPDKEKTPAEARHRADLDRPRRSGPPITRPSRLRGTPKRRWSRNSKPEASADHRPTPPSFRRSRIAAMSGHKRPQRWFRPSPPSRSSTCSRTICPILSTMTSPPGWRMNSTPSPVVTANPYLG